jgi:hypothetical protein
LDITYDFDLEDYMDALRSVRNGALGPSGITYALLRVMPSEVLEVWFGIALCCLQLRELPRSTLMGHIFTSPKAGEPSLENCRPVTLMEFPLKVLTSILNKRLMTGLLRNGVFSGLQFGFIPGRSGTDPVYIL